MKPDPHRPADEDTKRLVREMIAAARIAALAVLDDSGAPMISRIALQTEPDGTPLALLSALALHSAALARDPRAALLIDDTAAARGSPLTQRRLSLQVQAAPLARDPARLARWRSLDPKAAVYLDLPDFRFWRLRPVGGLLNGGFGKAWRLTAADLGAGPAHDNAPGE